MTINRPPSRRGVMLLEMLITIGLVAIFLVLAGKLYTTTLRLTYVSSEAERDIAAYESCVAALRRDAWNAAETTALPGGGLRITRGDGGVISWTADDEGFVVRQPADANAEPARRWPGLATKLRLEPDPAGVLVRAGDSELRLVSQVRMLSAEKP